VESLQCGLGCHPCIVILYILFYVSTFTSEINLIPVVYTLSGFLTPLTPKTRTPTPKIPYPGCGYGFWSGRGRGRPELPQGYPCGSLELLTSVSLTR